MIIVHATVHEDRMFVWGESSQDEHPCARRKTSKSNHESGKVKRCPFDAGRENLVSVFSEIVVQFKPNAKRFTDLTAWLPTKGDRPIPSSPMIADAQASKAKPKLIPWFVTGYPLSWNETVDLLCSCSGKRMLADGVLAGDDLAFWCETLRFSGSLVARQHYLPSVVPGEDEFRAIWQPVYLGDDADVLAQLAKRMPPVARTLTAAAAAQPPATPPLELLRRFIGSSLDDLVRSSKWDNPSIPKRNKKMAFDSIHDAWLCALKSPDNRIAGTEAELSALAKRSRNGHVPSLPLLQPQCVFAFVSKSLQQLSPPKEDERNLPLAPGMCAISSSHRMT
jgi:hypothetical protein